ncbi:MAG: hypothetical protein IJ561_00695 [Ruminococcus sp.]|nr:hypothetical protein [Ruminococcus sp.]
MTIEGILQLMEGLLEKSTAVPFSNKKMVDNEQMKEYIDSIRLNMPIEVNKAKEIELESQNIISNANREAEQIIRQAEERAKALVAEEEIIKQAREVAKQELEKAKEEADYIVEQAKERERSIKSALAANIEQTISDAQKAVSDSGKALAKSMEQLNATKRAIAEAGAAK